MHQSINMLSDVVGIEYQFWLGRQVPSKMLTGSRSDPSWRFKDSAKLKTQHTYRFYDLKLQSWNTRCWWIYTVPECAYYIFFAENVKRLQHTYCFSRTNSIIIAICETSYKLVWLLSHVLCNTYLHRRSLTFRFRRLKCHGTQWAYWLNTIKLP